MDRRGECQLFLPADRAWSQSVLHQGRSQRHDVIASRKRCWPSTRQIKSGGGELGDDAIDEDVTPLIAATSEDGHKVTLDGQGGRACQG